MVHHSSDAEAATAEPTGIRSRAAARQELARLGDKLRAMRRARGLSIERLAATASLSVGLLSQLERGSGNPSYLTLARVADALRVPIGYFFADEGAADQFVVRRAERKRLSPASAAVDFELLTPDLQRSLEMLWIEIAPGSPEPEPYQHGGEECLLVVQGNVLYHLGTLEYDLAEGDSITFPGDMPHWAVNPGAGVAKLVVAVVPPSF
jgi:transcriptional regulator with XRE-family HTH domain